MPITAHLTHRCTIARPTSTLDAYGARQPAYTPLATAVPCRLVERTQQAPLGVLAERPITTRITLLVLPTTDIRKTDRITDVIFDDGETDAGPFRVLSVLARRVNRRGVVHRSVELERIGK